MSGVTVHVTRISQDGRLECPLAELGIAPVDQHRIATTVRPIVGVHEVHVNPITGVMHVNYGFGHMPPARRSEAADKLVATVRNIIEHKLEMLAQHEQQQNVLVNT